MSEHDVVAYTDGGCRGNPGIGGWGFVLIHPASRSICKSFQWGALGLGGEGRPLNT